MLKKFITVLSGLLLIAGLAFIGYMHFNTPKVYVPDFKGEPVSSVKTWMKENSIEEDHVIFAYSYDETVPADHVITQTIKAGTNMKASQILSIRLSKGKDPIRKVALADFTDMKKQEIVKWFWENDLTNYKFIEEINDSKDEGTFIRSDPKAHTRVTEETEIVVYITKKTEVPDTVAFPNFLGYGQYDIQAWGNTNDIHFVFDTEYDNTIATGYFIRADVPAGYDVEVGSTVYIYLSAGPYYEQTTTPYTDYPVYIPPEQTTPDEPVTPVTPVTPDEPDTPVTPDEPTEPTEPEEPPADNPVDETPTEQTTPEE